MNGRPDMTWLDATLLKIHLGATDRIGGESAHDSLIQAAKRLGLRGATDTQGVLGFGPDGELHRAALFRFAQNLPVVVELADTPQAIETFLTEVSPRLPDSALLTTQAARLLERQA